jgi:AcrR family transcriptional regulator
MTRWEARDWSGMAESDRPARRYRGITAAQRTAERRERLLEAGLEVFGTDGYATSSVRAVAQQAQLNPRYFYESFTDREDLLYEVYLRIVTDIANEAIKGVAEAETIEDQARAGLRAGWMLLTSDPRKARIVALEVVGVSDRLEQLRRDTRHALADMTVRNAMSIASEGVTLRLDPVLTARALIGGVVELLSDWIHGDVTASPDEVVEHLTVIFEAAAYAAVDPWAAPNRPDPRRPSRSPRPDPSTTDAIQLAAWPSKSPMVWSTKSPPRPATRPDTRCRPTKWAVPSGR